MTRPSVSVAMTASPMLASVTRSRSRCSCDLLLGPPPLDDDGGLVGPDAQQQPVLLGREVGAAGAGDENPVVVADAEPGDGDVQRPGPERVGDRGGGSARSALSSGASAARHRLDVGGVGAALAADDFDRPLAGQAGQPDVDQVERQGVEQHVGQAAGDPLRAEAGPDGGQGREGDQIPHRPPQASVLFKGILLGP